MRRETEVCPEGTGCWGRLLVGGGAGDREEEKSFPVEAIFCPFPRASPTKEPPYQLWGQETEVWCPVNHRADLQPGARWRLEGGLEGMKGRSWTLLQMEETYVPETLVSRL